MAYISDDDPLWEIIDELEKIDWAVDDFADEMKKKMKQKLKEGYKGWDDIKNKSILSKKLKEHIEKGDMVDVANYCMMIWFMDKELKK